MRNSDQADHVNQPKSLPKTLLKLYWKYVTVELGDSQLWVLGGEEMRRGKNKEA